MHSAGAAGIEVDELAVGRIFGTVIVAFPVCQPLFFAAFDGYGVDIKLAVALAAERECSSIGGPAMPVRWRVLSNTTRSAAAEWQRVNYGLTFLRAVADGKQFAIGRNAMIVVDAGGKA